MRFWNLARRYPLVALATAGIGAGVALQPGQPVASQFLFAVVTVSVGTPLVISTMRAAARGRFQTDIIATLAILASIALGEWLAGAVIALMQSGGEALEDYGLAQARRSLDQLLRRAPTVAHILRGDTLVEVPAAEVVEGDRVVARAGDILPTDGTVVEGDGSVDESALTGEPVPLAKGPGDHVFSGTINLTGTFTYSATSNAAHSKYERIVQRVQQAEGERAPIQRLADRYVPWFTVAALVVAAAAWAISHDPARALAVLVVATPCPLIIATPLAVLCAIDRAAALNVIAKSGAAIERLAHVDTVAFDKTGTLTIGTPALVDVVATGEFTPDTLLAGAATVESRSGHVLARATVATARDRSLPIGTPQDWSEHPGSGLSARIDNRQWDIGSEIYLQEHGVSINTEHQELHESTSGDGRTVAWVAVDRNVAGFLAYADTLRPESPEMADRLRTLGIRKIVLITGDTAAAAKAVAEAIGADECHARTQPEDKQEHLRTLAGNGATVLMVGDGINDAPALASASVSIAMGDHGAGIATDTADIVITVENVGRVADAIAIGQRMVRVATQGIVGGMAASGILMLVAATGVIRPAVGAGLQEILDLLALANALRVRARHL